MPAAKRAPAKASSRAGTRTPPVRSAATRREVERQIARFEKHLDDAGEALALLGKDMGRGAQDAYREMRRTLTALRRDARKTNRSVLKDFDKLRAAVAPPRGPGRPSTRGGAFSTGSRASEARSGTSSSGARGSTRGGAAAAAAPKGGSARGPGTRQTRASAPTTKRGSRASGKRS